MRDYEVLKEIRDQRSDFSVLETVKSTTDTIFSTSKTTIIQLLSSQATINLLEISIFYQSLKPSTTLVLGAFLVAFEVYFSYTAKKSSLRQAFNFFQRTASRSAAHNLTFQKLAENTTYSILRSSPKLIITLPIVLIALSYTTIYPALPILILASAPLLISLGYFLNKKFISSETSQSSLLYKNQIRDSRLSNKRVLDNLKSFQNRALLNRFNVNSISATTLSTVGFMLLLTNKHNLGTQESILLAYSLRYITPLLTLGSSSYLANLMGLVAAHPINTPSKKLLHHNEMSFVAQRVKIAKTILTNLRVNITYDKNLKIVSSDRKILSTLFRVLTLQNPKESVPFTVRVASPKLFFKYIKFHKRFETRYLDVDTLSKHSASELYEYESSIQPMASFYEDSSSKVKEFLKGHNHISFISYEIYESHRELIDSYIKDNDLKGLITFSTSKPSVKSMYDEVQEI